jgi:membrane-bound lytic murein transglycosylase D
MRDLMVPTGTSTSFLAKLSDVPPQERLTFRRHKVGTGETLGVIALKYEVTLAELQRVNRISNPNRIYVGMELVVPVPGVEADAALTAMVTGANTGSSSTSRRTHATSHVVRKGESLSTIAAKYGVKQSDVAKWNGINNQHHIQAGQKLRIHTAESLWSTYKVRSGDTLSAIAARHGCSISELRSWNNLSGSRIYAGQTLKVKRS